MPEPEELIDLSQRSADPRADKSHHRDGFDDTVWFRMDIGRRQNADPRWILPLLCRRGHITRNEIGAIRIAANETFFQVPRAIEAKVREALQRTLTEGAEDESGIRIEPSPEGAQQGGGQSPRQPARAPVKRSEVRTPVQQHEERPAPAPEQSARQPTKKPHEPTAKPAARKQLGVAAGSEPRTDRKPPRIGRPGQKPPFKSGGPKPFKGGPKQTGAHRKGPRPR